MNRILGLSLAANGLLVLMVISDQRRLRRMRNWVTVLKDVFVTHLENGGTFDVPEQMTVNMEAFAIFIANDLD